MTAPAPWPPQLPLTDWRPDTPLVGRHAEEHNVVAEALASIVAMLGPSPAPLVVSATAPDAPPVGTVWIDISEG